MSVFQVVQQARVQVSVVGDAQSRPCLRLDFQDGRTHTFSALSRESELIEVFGSDMRMIESMFDKGTYAFYKDKLVDYRRSDYKGFIHSDASVEKLVELVGIEDTATQQRRAARGLFNRMRGRHSNGVFMGGEWDKFDLSVPALGVGGEFENRLLYRWSPFSPNIQTSLEVERLVCENGMLAMSPLLTFDVPVIDNWEENLDVVSMQLKPRVNAVLQDRFLAMEEMRASLGDVQRAHRVLSSRMDNADDQAHMRLTQLAHLTDVQRHLERFYDPAVFENRNLADRAESHLTQFALFNVLTEAASHTPSSQEASDAAIQMAINRLVFDEADRQLGFKARQIPEQTDSNPERAFFSSAGEEYSV